MIPKGRGQIPFLAERALEQAAERARVDGPRRFTDAALALLCEGCLYLDCERHGDRKANQITAEQVLRITEGSLLTGTRCLDG